MKILELYCGTKSIGKAAKVGGHEVFSVDMDPQHNPDYCCNILDFDIKRLPWIPDMIWASPPCTTFSVASMGHHWTGGKGAYIPKTKEALTGLKIMAKTKGIILALKPKLWWIENPRGVMRKVIGLEKYQHTVTYCQYGDKRMKPTDLFTNCTTWIPRPMCKNGSPCHEAAPRGSKTGTQGLKGAIERGVIPEQLCKEIILSCEKQITLDKQISIC
jgi:site-specific DNA-cytosine methylase